MAYSDKVLDHYNQPRNVGSLDKAKSNVGTGVVALMILPIMLWAIALFTRFSGIEFAPAVALALFHTLFNVLAVTTQTI